MLTIGQYEKQFGDQGLKLVESIERNAKRYLDILSKAVDNVMPKETQELT
jgi:DNA replication licensing factor MCM7